jgi:transcriptional antiterminator Rof (Rho-off)
MIEAPYQVISCERHSEYELMAMHRRQCRLCWQNSEKTVEANGIVLDILTRNRAEYLVMQESNGQRHEIRLDKIISLEPR